MPAGITKRTKTVVFESDNALRMYFYFKDADYGKYTFTLNGSPVEAVKVSSGRYYIERPNIASGELSTAFTFSVSDGTDTYTIEASALSYAYDRERKSTNVNMVRLAKLLYKYSQAANAYFQ